MVYFVARGVAGEITTLHCICISATAKQPLHHHHHHHHQHHAHDDDYDDSATDDDNI